MAKTNASVSSQASSALEASSRIEARKLADIYDESRRNLPVPFEQALPRSLTAPRANHTFGTSIHDTEGARIVSKVNTDYGHALRLPSALLEQQAQAGPSRTNTSAVAGQKRKAEVTGGLIDTVPFKNTGEIVLKQSEDGNKLAARRDTLLSDALIRKKEATSKLEKPAHHPQWKLSRVISGHLGWVRSITVDPYNQWFATGAGDRMIKIWDLASGQLKLSLTGHISTVRGLAVSARHPYLFSCGEDKMVKCWDLETNTVVRQYHGHLSGIYCLTLHPTLDVLITAGRDAVARVWDMRTKAQVHVLSGHKGTIASIVSQDSDPQVITGSMDATVRLWDLAAGKTLTTLTHHKKSVRALASHPQLFSFASGSSGGRNIKTWRCPEATLLNNATHDTIVNTLSVNPDGVLFSGGDDGSMKFLDYATTTTFQDTSDIPQPGSLDAEAGIFCSTFDHTGTRLLTGGADKTIKMYKEIN